MPNSSRTITFNFLIKNPSRATVEEFSSKPKPWEKRLKIQFNLFAHLLICLWIPIQEDETENFIPLLMIDKSKYFSEKKILIKPAKLSGQPSNTLPNEMLHHFIARQEIMNLGNLLFLNILFQVEELDTRYNIQVSHKTGKMYFSQAYKHYYQFYFAKRNINTSIFQETFLHPNLQRLTGIKKTKDFVKIHFEEISLLFLNLYLTPWALVEKLGLHYLHDFQESSAILKDFKSNLYEHLTALEQLLEKTCPDKWQQFQKNELKKPSIIFTNTLQKFIKNAPFLNQQDLSLINFEIMHHSLQLNIPNFNHLCYPQSLKFLPLAMYTTCFNYLQRKSIEHWDVIKNNSKHIIWKELEEQTKFLLKSKLQDSPEILDLSLPLFLKAITFNYANLALFYIKFAGNFKNFRLSFIPNNDPSLRPLKDKIGLVIALEYQNQFIAEQLKTQYYYLNEYEKDFIKQLLQKFVLSHNLEAFQFTTSLCPSIHKDRLFIEHLGRLCHETSQNFLKYLPLKPINTKNLSPEAIKIISSESESDSDSDNSSTSSSSDEYHIKFRFFNEKPREPATLEEIFQRFPNLKKNQI